MFVSLNKSKYGQLLTKLAKMETEINNLFVPYELAVIAKEKGFIEPCLYAFCKEGGWNKYKGVKEEITIILKTDGNPFGGFFVGKNWNKVIDTNKNKIQCSAPLYQQIVDWFSTTHNIEIFSNPAFMGVKNTTYHPSVFRKIKTELGYEWEDDLFSDKPGSYTKKEALNKAIEEAFKLI